MGGAAEGRILDTSSATPEVVRPGMKLPAAGADGRLAGYEPGWQATTHPIEFVPPMDLDVKATSLAAMTVNGMSVAMADIVAADPRAHGTLGRELVCSRSERQASIHLGLALNGRPVSPPIVWYGSRSVHAGSPPMST
jgi:hypothetical protein